MISLLSLLLAAQPQAARPAPAKPSVEWLTGLWVEQKQPGMKDLDQCASWDALFYRADSTFAQGEREGFWVLRGNRVYELDQPPEAVGPDQLAERTSTLIVRAGPDRMRKALPGGRFATFIRCPKPETPVDR